MRGGGRERVHARTGVGVAEAGPGMVSGRSARCRVCVKERGITGVGSAFESGSSSAGDQLGALLSPGPGCTASPGCSRAPHVRPGCVAAFPSAPRTGSRCVSREAPATAAPGSWNLTHTSPYPCWAHRGAGTRFSAFVCRILFGILSTLAALSLIGESLDLPSLLSSLPLWPLLSGVGGRFFVLHLLWSVKGTLLIVTSGPSMDTLVVPGAAQGTEASDTGPGQGCGLQRPRPPFSRQEPSAHHGLPPGAWHRVALLFLCLS